MSPGCPQLETVAAAWHVPVPRTLGGSRRGFLVLRRWQRRRESCCSVQWLPSFCAFPVPALVFIGASAPRVSTGALCGTFSSQGWLNARSTGGGGGGMGKYRWSREAIQALHHLCRRTTNVEQLKRVGNLNLPFSVTICLQHHKCGCVVPKGNIHPLVWPQQ